MSVDTKLKELIINTLSPEQLPEQPSDTEIYLVEDDAEYATVEELAEKQDKVDNDLATVSKTVVGAINEVRDKVQEIEAARFPNAIIIGEPTISQGQVSGFSVANYLQFPFVVDLTNRRFTAEFCFTTGDDVATQQNILDSQFGLALAISNGKGLMAISHNGTSWAGSVAGTLNIQPNTTYYAKLSWNRINYQTQLSTDGTTYTPDMNFGSTQSPYPRTMFIGGCSGTAIGHTAHPFKGTINLNKCRLYIEDVEVWRGMDDVGLATRADVSLDNLDARGEARFAAKQNKLIAGENITIDEATNTISATGGGSSDIDNTTITTNANQQIQAVAVIDQNTGIAKTWTGTMAEYEAIVTKDPETEYIITDDIGGPANAFRKDVSERNIGEIVYSSVPITDSGLHLADGEVLDGTGIYKDFYDYMVGVYNAGHTSIFCSESDYQAEITAHARCGKYVLDTANQTIRLPNILGHLYATHQESSAGAYVEPGLPNITGQFAPWGYRSALEPSGAFTQEGTGTHAYSAGDAWAGSIIKFNASRSSSIYGASDTVETPAIKVLVYIVVANTAKVPVQVDIDNIATELNACYAHRVVEFQEPTEANGYTWYRKYADGWVEQGGIQSSNTGSSGVTVNLPITMADTNYTVIGTVTEEQRYFVSCLNKTTTSFFWRTFNVDAQGYDKAGSWQVSGMAS